MMHIRFKYKVALSSIVIMMVMVTLTGFSYAYFTTEVTGQGNKIEIATGDVQMTFTKGEKNIDLTNEYPIPDGNGLEKEPYTFSLTNPNAFPVKVYVFIDVLDESDSELAKHIKVAYKNGDASNVEAAPNKGYTIKFLDIKDDTLESGAETSGEKWPRVEDTIYANSTSYLLDTISLGESGNPTSSKNNLSLLLWIDEATGGVQECTIDETTGQCTTPTDITMGKTFKAVISVVTIPDREAQHVTSDEPGTGE